MIRSVHLIVWSIATLALVLAGCAKYPLVVSRGADDSGRQTTSLSEGVQLVAATGESHSSAATTTPGATARPAPKDFAAVSALKMIHFDFDKYDIRPAEAKVLEANAEWLKANAAYAVLIEGHCDERGTSEYNVALGDRRAKAARSYLIAHGVAAHRIAMISYGFERPMCDGHDERCWSQNRRALFLVKSQ